MIRPFSSGLENTLRRIRWPVWFAVLGGVLGCDDPVPHVDTFHARVLNPYLAPGDWHKANFHAHTKHSDGRGFAAEVVQMYRDAGYSVIGITDHNAYGDQDGGILPEYQSDEDLHDWNGDGVLHAEHVPGSGVETYVRNWNEPPPLWHIDRWSHSSRDLPLVLSGVEASFSYWGAHFCLLDIAPGAFPPSAPGFDWLDRPHGFAFIAHPGRANAFPDRFRGTVPVQRFHGMEIVNGFFLTSGGPALATELWDAFLSSGYRIFGLANDDRHRGMGEVGGPFTAYNVLKLTEVTVQHVVDALRNGRFYASTGLEFTQLELQEQILRVEAPGAHCIRFIGQDGVVLQETTASRAEYAFTGLEAYVRVEASGETLHYGSWSWPRQAWTQPYFLTQPTHRLLTE